MLNRLLITLAGTLDWHLHTPANRFEDAPDVVTMIADTKAALDQHTHAVLGPDRAKEAVALVPGVVPKNRLKLLHAVATWDDWDPQRDRYYWKEPVA